MRLYQIKEKFLKRQATYQSAFYRHDRGNECVTTEKQLQPVIRLDIKPEIFGFQLRIAPHPPPTRLRFPFLQFNPKLTLSLPGFVTSRLFDTPTFKSVDEILWCYHSNDTSWAELLDSNIHFFFTKIKFKLLCEVNVWKFFKFSLLSTTRFRPYL